MANNGDFTCTELQEIEIRLQSKWPDNAYDAQKAIVKGGTIRALLNEQTATFQEVEDKSVKSNTVKLYWLEDCPITTQACNVTCTAPAGIEFGSNCQTVDCDTCIEAQTIQIAEENLRTNLIDFDEQVAAALYRADQAITEAVNVDAIQTLDAASDQNLYTDTWGGRVNPASAPGECTIMDATVWADPWGYFTITAAQNNYTDPYLIGGSILYKFTLNPLNPAMPALTGDDGVTRVGDWRVYYDLRAMDQELTPDKKAFMVNRGEFAYVNCYNYPDVSNRKAIGGGETKWVYRIQSPIMSAYAGRPIYHDVVYTVKCAANNSTLSNIHCWQILHRYSIEQSPADCDGHNRVLCFTCGDPTPAPA